MAKRYTFKYVDTRYATDVELGAIYSHEFTEFRVWSPLAENVALNLWLGGSKQRTVFTMERGKRGVWSIRINGDLDGALYTYSITHNGVVKETIDIYAKASDINGVHGIIFDPKRATVDGWENERVMSLNSYTDAVIYELHVRDFSMDNSGSFTNRGRLAAFCENGTTNIFNDTIGLEYIADLGVTHIHFLPIMDYGSVDENAPTFNWGYDPLNYNIPEGSYCKSPEDGVERVRELKSLISAVHRHGLGVILDVVYNHTYDADNSPFGKTFPHYYYRHENGRYSNGSGCGNELATERYMVRRYISDSLCYIAKEYKIDGFRFDLMGLIDVETLNQCAIKLREINPNIILYGEGWTGGFCPLSESERALKHNACKVPQYAMFSDDIRDSIKGSVFSDLDRGYVNGNPDAWHREMVKSSLVGGIYHKQVKRIKAACWSDSPTQCVNYVEAHDNLTLNDKLMLSMPNSTVEQRIAANKMAAALVILAQGIPFMQAGQEMLRSKPISVGEYDHNSYCSSDSVNSIKWNDVTINSEIVAYYRGLISIRKKFKEFRLSNGDDIRTAISFRNLKNGAFVMKNDDLWLIVNPTNSSIDISAESYAVYVDAEHASSEPLYYGKRKASAAPHSILLIKILEDIDSVVDRIRKMELYFDTVQNVFQVSPEELETSESVIDMLEELIHYYEGGQWLEDFRRDEHGELPSELKRGILSEDAIYDLLSDIKQIK